MLLPEYNEIERDELLLRKGMKKGMEKGRIEGILSSIRSLMQTMHLSAEEAMKVLLIPESDWNKYSEQLRG